MTPYGSGGQGLPMLSGYCSISAGLLCDERGFHCQGCRTAWSPGGPSCLPSGLVRP